MAPRLRIWVIIGSIPILRAVDQPPVIGGPARTQAPPNAEPFRLRRVTSWKGRVLVVVPAGVLGTIDGGALGFTELERYVVFHFGLGNRSKLALNTALDDDRPRGHAPVYAMTSREALRRFCEGLFAL